MNKSAFIPIFERLKNQIKATLAKYKLPIQAQSHLLNSLDYNVPHGKMLRGLSVPNSLYILDPTKSLDEAAILGWAVEFLQASFLIADDIMDHSTVRRGRPCWYKKVELTAVNDAFLVESMVYQIIKLNFKSDKYVRIVDLFHEISFKTELGQLMDLITAPETVDIDKFTRETYEYIVEYKTAYYSFYLPVALALILNDNDESCFVIAQGIL